MEQSLQPAMSSDLGAYIKAEAWSRLVIEPEIAGRGADSRPTHGCKGHDLGLELNALKLNKRLYAVFRSAGLL